MAAERHLRSACMWRPGGRRPPGPCAAASRGVTTGGIRKSAPPHAPHGNSCCAGPSRSRLQWQRSSPSSSRRSCGGGGPHVVSGRAHPPAAWPAAVATTAPGQRRQRIPLARHQPSRLRGPPRWRGAARRLPRSAARSGSRAAPAARAGLCRLHHSAHRHHLPRSLAPRRAAAAHQRATRRGAPRRCPAPSGGVSGRRRRRPSRRRREPSGLQAAARCRRHWRRCGQAARRRGRAAVARAPQRGAPGQQQRQQPRRGGRRGLPPGVGGRGARPRRAGPRGAAVHPHGRLHLGGPALLHGGLCLCHAAHLPRERAQPQVPARRLLRRL